jgi:hypothetical protein
VTRWTYLYQRAVADRHAWLITPRPLAVNSARTVWGLYR